jgi:hypothetical protein
MQQNAASELGTPIVIATQGRGMSPDEWVELALNRILYVADTAPMPIREQAKMFQDHLRAVLLTYFKKVARSERTTIANILRREGLIEAADKLVDID